MARLPCPVSDPGVASAKIPICAVDNRATCGSTGHKLALRVSSKVEINVLAHVGTWLLIPKLFARVLQRGLLGLAVARVQLALSGLGLLDTCCFKRFFISGTPS